MLSLPNPDRAFQIESQRHRTHLLEFSLEPGREAIIEEVGPHGFLARPGA